MPEKKIKQELIASAHIKPNAKVLDFGCGTATLPINQYNNLLEGAKDALMGEVIDYLREELPLFME